MSRKETVIMQNRLRDAQESVYDLQSNALNLKRHIDQLMEENDRMRAALEKIAQWNGHGVPSRDACIAMQALNME